MKNKYSLKEINYSRYSTIKISTDQQLKTDKEVKYLTDEQIKNGEQGIIFVPWILKEHTTESLKDYNSFMKKYRKQHEVCPKCGAKEHITTLMGYPMYSDRREEYKDLNSCLCVCGDVHSCHDRISIKEFKNKI
jgi:hypothetical protein